jgi:hypothetical protein
MIGFDIRGKRKKEKWLKAKSEINDFPEDVSIVENDFKEEEKTQEEDRAYPN